jgi:hypothetical protein
MEDARTFLNQAYRYEILSAKSFAAAAELIDRNLESLETLVRYVAKGCELTVRYGIKIVYPAAAPLADAIYLGINFGITTKLEGVDQAVKDALIDTVLQLIFFDKKFISLGDNTLLEYVNRVSEFVPLDTLLANEEFMQEFGIYLRVVLEERGWEAFAELITNAVANWLVSLADSITGEKKSPVDIRVFDSKGRVTGLINGVVKHEIPMSLYYNGTVTIFFPSDTYYFEVAGTDEGTYGLEITSVRAGNVTEFTATDIPTSLNTIHQYTIDWNALSRGEEGVTVQVDSDGDGVFEQTFTTGNLLTYDEFLLKTETTVDLDPDALNLDSRGKWVTAYIEFPEGFNVADINVSSILLNNTIPVDPSAPWAIGDYDGDGVPDLMVKFDRAEVISYILANVNITKLFEERFMTVTLTITGYLNDGTPFQGSTAVKIIMPMPRCGRFLIFPI